VALGGAEEVEVDGALVVAGASFPAVPFREVEMGVKLLAAEYVDGDAVSPEAIKTATVGAARYVVN
jgi:hypothetical protein